MFELDSRISRGKMPVNAFLPCITVNAPCFGFGFQDLHISDSPAQTFPCKHGKFSLCHVEPRAVFRCMVHFETLPYSSCLCRFKGFIQRRYVVRVQVVTYQNYLFSIRVVFVDKAFYLLRPVCLAAMFQNGHPSPAPKRLGEHEAAACPVLYVFMVNLFSMVALRQVDGLPAVIMQLDGLFVHANHWGVRVIRPCIDFQHILHVRHESGILLGRYAPCLLQVRLILVFFRIRPTCVCEIESTISNSTALSAMSRRRWLLFSLPHHPCISAGQEGSPSSSCVCRSFRILYKA